MTAVRSKTSSGNTTSLPPASRQVVQWRDIAGDPDHVEIINDPELAAAYRERLERPINEAKKERLRSAQRAGQIAADADLDLFLDVLYAPLSQRCVLRSGALDDDFADALVHTALRAFQPI